MKKAELLELLRDLDDDLDFYASPTNRDRVWAALADLEEEGLREGWAKPREEYVSPAHKKTALEVLRNTFVFTPRTEKL